MDDLLSLRAAINNEPELRGRTSLEGAEASGTLGALADTLIVVAGPAAFGAVTSATVAWIRNQRADVDIKIKVKGGALIEFHGKRIRNASTEELRGLIAASVKEMTDE